ncbi:UDP-D-xylose:L-fucose alpha-1,3-D-xylosyltransferase 3 [Strongylocentrotus purpuratus]|uniref:Nucleotide-diphospho-sugar transferase domain-containing protein n=1 Tax=Strongylocentrotus purpuratus TaxID=7668 RepID=A0A7M7N0K6_STRPU|nr:UDP-D-xylose:L-fucose alpha-1,3-D-xylosyltransferase 3 [Strongylocentrotus purpuratus]
MTRRWYRGRRLPSIVISTMMALCYVCVRLYVLQQSHVPDKQPPAKKKPIVSEQTRLTTQPSISPEQFNIRYKLNISNDGPLVLITSNKAFMDFAENWLESVHRLESRLNIFAIAEDMVAYRTFLRYPDVTTVMTQRAVSPQKRLAYLSHDYNVLINKRPVYIYRLLAKGRDVLFSDVDTVWLKDPLPHLDGDYDVVLQVDLRVPKVVYCAGFIFFRATNASRAFVWEWIDRIHKARDNIPDQKILNELLEENFGDLRVKVLDSALFPNGALYFDDKWRRTQTVKPVIVHNNWIEDHDEKVLRFKSHGFWFI